MIEIPVWVIPTILFILMHGLILMEIIKLENKINDLEFKLGIELTSPTGAEGSCEE